MISSVADCGERHCAESPPLAFGVRGGGTKGREPTPCCLSPPGHQIMEQPLNLLPVKRLVLIGCLAFRLRRFGPLSLLS